MLLCLLLWYPGKEKKNKSMVGFDILNITGSVSKSKHKNPFCAVTEDSIMSPTLANSIWASGLEKEWTTANVESDGKPPFLPLLPLGLALQFPGGSSALPSQAPGASTSCSCPLGALFYVYWRNQSPPLHYLWANISFTDQDLQQPQLGLNLLVFIVFFRHRSAVFFLHVPRGSKKRSWGFLCQDIFPQQPPSTRWQYQE